MKSTKKDKDLQVEELKKLIENLSDESKNIKSKLKEHEQIQNNLSIK